MTVTNELFLIAVSVLIYVVLGINWNFQLFAIKNKAGEDNNAIKGLLIWLIVWIQPLLIQLSLLYATDLSRSANILNLLTVYYQITVVIGIVISVYFMVFFGYNAMLFLSGVGGKK